MSSDNPRAKAGVQDVEDRPDWPTRFTSSEHATSQRDKFFSWYNDEHHHTSIGPLTPADRHAGNGQRINAARQAVLDAAYKGPTGTISERPPPPATPTRTCDQTNRNPINDPNKTANSY